MCEVLCEDLEKIRIFLLTATELPEPRLLLLNGPKKHPVLPIQPPILPRHKTKNP
jgi:hypothetical protein